MKRKVGVTLMSIGALLIFCSLSLLLFNNIQSKKAYENSLAIMQFLKTDIAENAAKKDEYKGEDPFETEMKTVEIDGYEYIGYVNIPKLNLDLPVMATIDKARLKIAVCRYYGSVKTDNLVLAAHNYRYHFGYLNKLTPSDKIIFTDVDSNEYAYTVKSIETLLPTDVDKVKDSGDDLILYTCTYGGAKRVTVRCAYEN